MTSSELLKSARELVAMLESQHPPHEAATILCMGLGIVTLISKSDKGFTRGDRVGSLVAMLLNTIECLEPKR